MPLAQRSTGTRGPRRHPGWSARSSISEPPSFRKPKDTTVSLSMFASPTLPARRIFLTSTQPSSTTGVRLRVDEASHAAIDPFPSTSYTEHPHPSAGARFAWYDVRFCRIGRNDQTTWFPCSGASMDRDGRCVIGMDVPVEVHEGGVRLVKLHRWLVRPVKEGMEEATRRGARPSPPLVSDGIDWSSLSTEKTPVEIQRTLFCLLSPPSDTDLALFWSMLLISFTRLFGNMVLNSDN